MTSPRSSTLPIMLIAWSFTSPPMPARSVRHDFSGGPKRALKATWCASLSVWSGKCSTT